MGRCAWVVLHLVLSAGLILADDLSTTRVTVGGVTRVVLTPCDVCLTEEQIRLVAVRLLPEGEVVVGTAEWYGCALDCAQEESLVAKASDTGFDDWRDAYQSRETHLWAQAIRLGNRLGVRIRGRRGEAHQYLFSGEGLFEQPRGSQFVCSTSE